MDVFDRTFLPASAEAGLAVQTVSRHMPIFRRCVRSDDATILVSRCTRPDRSASGEHLLLLTYQRLVVTRQSLLLHRLHLHLNTELRHLSDVTWHPEPRLQRVELAATVIDGVRERFLFRTEHPKQVWQIDALLDHAFRSRLRLPRVVTESGRPVVDRKPVPTPHRPTAASSVAGRPVPGRRPVIGPRSARRG